jgi:hypothetical protein
MHKKKFMGGYDTLIPPPREHAPGTPLEVLQFIVNNNNFVPNVAVALRIILTRPVSVASGEQSFSKLKIIKNCLKPSMNQERLSDLATISIEK